jgi:hypothetical protein
MTDNIVTDPISGCEAELRKIQPFQAIKTYECPGCNQEIFPATGHVVVVPVSAVDLRRHWHTPCWQRASR